MVSQLEIKFELYTRYKFDTTQVNGLNLFDCPGFNSKLYLRQNSTVIPPGCGQHGIWGKWNFQKDSMYTSNSNTFSNGFSKNQIKIKDDRMRRIVRQEMRENRDYYYDSNAYNDQK